MRLPTSAPKAAAAIRLGLLAAMLAWLGLPGAAAGDPVVAGDGLRLNGQLRQGALLTGRTEPGTRVFFAGKPVRLGPDGGFVVGLGRRAPDRVPLAWTQSGGAFHLRMLEVAQRRYEVQRIDGLPGRLVHPDEAALKRIRREQSRVADARQRFSPFAAYRRGFRWPLTGPVTGVYGTRRVLNGEPRQPHYGVDIAAPAGTVIRAPTGGVVRLADPDLYFSGGTLILDHGHGVSSTFLHLNAILVDKGEQVTKGQPIAKVGATGRVTGAHLDWRMNWFGRRLDPALLAGPMPGKHGTDHARGG